MNTVANHINILYDRVHRWWHGTTRNRIVGSTLVLTYLVSFLLIELKRHDLLPVALENLLPGNHFYAIGVSAVVYVLVLTLAYNRFVPVAEEKESPP